MFTTRHSTDALLTILCSIDNLDLDSAGYDVLKISKGTKIEYLVAIES